MKKTKALSDKEKAKAAKPKKSEEPVVGEDEGNKIQEEIGNKIQYIRKEVLKLTQKELADLCEFVENGQSTVFYLEKGRGSALSIFMLLKKLHSKGINLNFLFANPDQNVSVLGQGSGGDDSYLVETMKNQVDHFLVNLSIIQDKITKTQIALEDYRKDLGEE